MRGKFVLVQFPFDDGSASKLRPVLCLTDLMGLYRHVIVAYLTSRVPVVDPLPSDFVLAPSDPGFARSGLRVDSAMGLHRLLTLPVVAFKRELGELEHGLQLQVDERVRLMLRVG